MRDLNRESGSFIYLQLFKRIIQNIVPNQVAMNKSKQEMLEKCHLYYRDNKKEMENIAKFEREYTSNQAIKWYTNDSFIYKLVNKALRTEDINTLYTYRFYIRDLRACLAENCQLLREYTSKMMVYRGAKMSKTEIERLCNSIGHLLAVNGYLSTSRNKCVSEMFAGIGSNNLSNTDNIEAIIFFIEVDLEKSSETILADIQHLSSHKDEEEVLFDFGSVFKIESMEYDEQLHYWKCSLSASDEGYTVGKEYINYAENELGKCDDIELIFGSLLLEMGEWSKGRIYFENLKQRRSYDPRISFFVGLIHQISGELDQALSHLMRAFNSIISQKKEFMAFTALVCCSILQLYHMKGDLNRALRFGDKALELCQQVSEYENVMITAQVLMSIGLVHFDKGNDDTSLEYLERSFRLLQRICPFDNPAIMNCLNSLSCAHYHKGDYNKALDCLLRCAEIGEQLLPIDHPIISSIENNIGKQFYKQGKYDEALQRFRRAADIDERTSTSSSDGHIVVLNNIGKALYRLNKFDEAIMQYDKAFDLIEKIFRPLLDHPYVAYTLKNKGEVLFALNDLFGAFELFKQAHDIYERLFEPDNNHRDIAKCKYLIGLTHLALGNEQKAADALDKALRMWTNVLPKNHPDLALCHQSMGDLHIQKKGETDKAFLHFRTTISIYEEHLPVDHQRLRDLKRKLSDLHN
ncbi:unnamed protein product [Rotaria sp. Silwood1]|nr:unnamed protein product [Rotaria sp. Silwood1]